MKTFKELQDYACLLAPLDTYAKINKWAAKEYAKQWVVIAVALAGADRSVAANEATIKLLESKIDAQ